MRFRGILERSFLCILKNVDWSIIMNTDQRPKYYLYTQAFEKAKWLLTDKKSGEVTEYDYSGMSSIVIDAYKSHKQPL